MGWSVVCEVIPTCFLISDKVLDANALSKQCYYRFIGVRIFAILIYVAEAINRRPFHA